MIEENNNPELTTEENELGTRELHQEVLKRKSTIDRKVHELLGNSSKYFHNRVTLLSYISPPLYITLMIY